MTNKEKFLALVSPEDPGTIERIRERIRNRAMLRESQQIALKVLMKLDDYGWSQKDLAKQMGVSPQQINKIVSGKENLTIETQVKLQEILDIPILASYYEQKNKIQADSMYIRSMFCEKVESGTVALNQYSHQTKVISLISERYTNFCKVAN